MQLLEDLISHIAWMFINDIKMKKSNTYYDDEEIQKEM